MTKRKPQTLSGTLGGIIVGFDQQIFRTTPPVQELVAKGQPVRGLSGEGGSLDVVFPDDIRSEDIDPDATPDDPEAAPDRDAAPDDPDRDAPDRDASDRDAAPDREGPPARSPDA